MNTQTLHAPRRWQTIAGRIASALVFVFMLLDAGGKLLQADQVLEASRQIGFPVQLTQPLGAIVLACAVLYAYPRTGILGAILTTGLLGGAVATHVRLGSQGEVSDVAGADAACARRRT